MAWGEDLPYNRLRDGALAVEAWKDLSWEEKAALLDDEVATLNRQISGDQAAGTVGESDQPVQCIAAEGLPLEIAPPAESLDDRIGTVLDIADASITAARDYL